MHHCHVHSAPRSGIDLGLALTLWDQVDEAMTGPHPIYTAVPFPRSVTEDLDLQLEFFRFSESKVVKHLVLTTVSFLLPSASFPSFAVLANFYCTTSTYLF